MDIISKIRRIQTIVSITIFIVVFLFSWYETKFNLLDIQLSYWGVADKASNYWNGMTMILALSLFFNVDYYVKHHIRMVDKQIIRLSFGSVFLSLFLTGLINMHYKIHDFTAVYYFFLLPFTIYLMAYLNRKTIQYKEWLINVILSTCMIILPLIFINLFKGMAISETIHSIIVVLWGLWILNK